MQMGALILAAGAATRMGCIKQLLPYNGTTLVEHAIRQAEEADFHPIVAVMGAQADDVEHAVRRTSAHSFVNQRWRSGIGSSIASGITHLLDIAPEVGAVVILLADQPHVCSHHLLEMQRLFIAGSHSILGSRYADTAGVPAIFARGLFSKLQTLEPDSGARSLLRQGDDPAHFYDLPEAATDVDTPEDFARVSSLPQQDR